MMVSVAVLLVIVLLIAEQVLIFAFESEFFSVNQVMNLQGIGQFSGDESQSIS